MSADNAIIILHTKDNWKKIGDNHYQNLIGGKIDAYRVAHTSPSALDIDWYKMNEPHNIGLLFYTIYKNSEIYYSYDEATEKAHEMYTDAMETIGIVEYGIYTEHVDDYPYPIHF